MNPLLSKAGFSPFSGMGGSVPGTELQFEQRERPPGWLEEGFYYQTFPDSQYPYNPAIVKACREIDPTLIPLWVKWVFKRPMDDSRGWEYKVFGRHGLAKYVPNPVTERPGFKVLKGFNDQSPIPNVMLEIFDDNRPDMKEEGQGDLPGKYLPFEWYIYYGVKSLFLNANKGTEHDTAVLVKRREDQKKQNEDFWEDFNRDKDDFTRTFSQPRLDASSEIEARDFLQSKKFGLNQPQPKPYAFLGH